MNPALVRQLRRIVGEQNVLDEQRHLLAYAYDAALTTHVPELVVLPASTAEVQEALAVCMEARVPVSARGSATSLSGGPVPVQGGVSLALTRMDEILALDFENRRAVVQAGVINSDLIAALEPHGYFYGPDPASQTVCTLGGNVATNAGGPHCLKYGVTTNHVLGLRVVLVDGEMVELGGATERWQGLDLAGLVVGSEGTLALVTEATLRIMPAPESRVTMLAVFESVEQASEAASEIIAAGIIPAALELMDRPLIQAVQKSLDAGYPEDAGAVLIIEVEGLEASTHEELTEIQQICRMHFVTRFEAARDDAARELLWRGRKGTTAAVAHIAPRKLCSDITVPRHALPLVVNEIIRIGERHKLQVGSLVHAGDGNLHPQLIFDPRDRDQVRRALAADDEVSQLAVDVGGVLSGEHGIGHQKRKYMPRAFGPAELRVMHQVKALLDPLGVLNPGKVLPDEGAGSTAPEPYLPPGDFATAAPELAWHTAGVLTPPHEEELASLLALAAREGVRLRICGGGTASAALERGEEVVVVSTQALDQLSEHDHTNLTVTAGAGMGLAELQRIVAAEHQMMPLFPPDPDGATLGGAVSADDQGPQALGYGRCRDLVTGLTVALSTGELLSLGSKCVKDVAGYDLKRLFIGSRGSLGAIAQVTIRTLPMPEQRQTLVLSSDEDTPVAEAAATILAAPLRPAALEAVDGPALFELCDSSHLKMLGQRRWTLVVEIAGSSSEVEETAQRVRELGSAAGLSDAGELEPDEADELWRAIASLRGGVPPERLGVTLSVDPARALEAAGRAGELATGLGLTILRRASPASGQVRLRVREGAAEDQLAKFVHRLSEIVPPQPGCLRAVGLPLESQDDASMRLSRQIKDIFDPAGVLPPVPGVAM
jgi:D-lactate dehydrogenase (cytochrome)